MNDQSIEQEIQAKGLTAPRVTPADIEANIAGEHFFTAGDGFAGVLSLSPEFMSLHEDDRGGLTAYVGLTRIAQVKPGDVVFVSGAAGAVGSGQGLLDPEVNDSRPRWSPAGRQRSTSVVSNA